jgi:pyruvate dehydrogenase E1 component alpha subunit
MTAAQAADPVPAFRQQLADAGVSAEELDDMDAAADRAVEDAIATVMAAPLPPLDELERDVYADARNCPV